MGEVILVGAFGLHQRAFAAVGPQPRIDREDDAIAGIRADHADHPFGHAGPEQNFVRIVVGDNEDQIGVRSQIEFEHAEPAERHDHHLIRRRVPGTQRRSARASFGERNFVRRTDNRFGQFRSSLERLENGHAMIHAVALNADHLVAEVAPQAIRIPRGGEARAPLLLAAGRADFLEQFRVADKLIREILTVLENVDGAPRQLGRCFRAFRATPDWPRPFRETIRRSSLV